MKRGPVFLASPDDAEGLRELGYRATSDLSDPLLDGAEVWAFGGEALAAEAAKRANSVYLVNGLPDVRGCVERLGEEETVRGISSLCSRAKRWTPGADAFPGWDEPIRFDEPSTPDFPTEMLPGALAAFVEALAESTQTPEEMAGLLSLGVLATAFQSRYTVRVTPDWEEPLCLYCVAVAPPGERKSAVFSALLRPVNEYERERQDAEAVEVERNRTERELLEAELQAAKTAAAKGKGDRQRALDLAEELARFAPMAEFRLLADDATPEKLVELLERHGGSLTVCSAEGGVFDAMRGRYERSVNLDVYLKGHAGDPVTVDRIGRRMNRVDHPRLSMLLTVQPEVLAGLMGNATFRGRGLCGRFLYAVCRSRVGHREIRPEAVPEAVRLGYHDFVRCILSGQGRGTILLSPEADALRCEFQAEVERKLGDEWESMRDWGGKLVGAMMRVAALLHCANALDEPSEIPISGETMTAAIRIGEYLGAHAAAAYQTMGAEDEAEADAKYILRRVRGMERVTRTELTRLCRGRFARVEEMDRALSVLEERGYIKTTEAEIGYNGRTQTTLLFHPALVGN